MSTHGFSGFADFIEAVRQCFAFLAEHGFDEPRIHLWPPRECTLVYWGTDGVNVAVFHDLGGPPQVQIVPLRHSRADGSTRSFGLGEAVAELAPRLNRQRPGSGVAGWERHLDTAWLEWYAGFLRAHAADVLAPAPALLDRIEARRSSRAPKQPPAAKR